MSIFGQTPADIAGALFKASNLSDIPDKNAARTNLNVPSKDDVLYNSVPIGMILPYWGSVAPGGYLPCSGQTINSTSFPNLVTFLGGTTTAVVPDLRGEFLRGWDNGRGLDSGRAINTVQVDALQNIKGSYGSVNSTSIGQSFTGAFSGDTLSSLPSPSGALGSAFTNVTFDASGSARTSTETRPHNVSVLYCIKAYTSVNNYTSSFNVSGLVSDYSNLSSSTVKYSDWAGTNQSLASTGYQKMPGGLIYQWGVSTVGANSSLSVTLPVTFPSSALNCISSFNQQDTSSTSGYTSCYALSTSQISVSNATNASKSIYWMVIGK